MPGWGLDPCQAGALRPEPTLGHLALLRCWAQMFEGFAIGSAAVDSGLSAKKAFLMGLIYSLTTPTGIAIGKERRCWPPGSLSRTILQCILAAAIPAPTPAIILSPEGTPHLSAASGVSCTVPLHFLSQPAPARFGCRDWRARDVQPERAAHADGGGYL